MNATNNNEVWERRKLGWGADTARARAWVLLLGVAIMACANTGAQAQPLQTTHWCVLRAGDFVAETQVPAVSWANKDAAPTAVFEVSYSGFSPEARAAFQFAVDQWSRLIASPVPIRIEASLTPLEEGVLGSAGSNLFANFSEAPHRSRWYAAPLADALSERDQDDEDVDIFASFNSNRTDWYFGIDGRGARHTYDFASVVMHEIAHGLGFTASYHVNNGGFFDARCGGNEGLGCWGLNTNAGQIFPYIFDDFIEDRNGGFLLDEVQYPNPSGELADVLQSTEVMFDSPTVEVANNGGGVLMYAPAPYEIGSSLSHVDEDRYPAGTPNSLMSPLLGRAESVFNPGPLVCAMLQDIGWNLGPDCLALMGSDIVSFEAERQGNAVLLTWEATAIDAIDAFRIEQRFFDGEFEAIHLIEVEEGDLHTYAFTTDALEPGYYAFRILQLQADGSSVVGAQVGIEIPLLQQVKASSVYPNPFNQRAQLEIQVQETQPVHVALFDVQGRQLEVLANQVVQAQSLLQITFDGSRLQSGVYFIRIVGDDFLIIRSAVVVGAP